MNIGDHVEWNTRVRGHTYKGEIVDIKAGEFGVRWYAPDPEYRYIDDPNKICFHPARYLRPINPRLGPW